MSTFRKCLLPMAKSRINVDIRIGVSVRVFHRGKMVYIPTGVDVGCSKVGRKIVPHFDGEMVTCREEGWLAKNVEVDRVYQIIVDRYSRVVNPGVMACDELCMVLRSDGFCPKGNKVGIDAAFEMFIDSKTGEVSKSYIDMMGYAVRRFRGWCGGLVLDDITPEVIGRYDKFLHKVRKTGTKRLLSDSQICKEKAQLKALLNWCEANGLVKFKSNPFAKVAIPRSDRRECAVTNEEFKRIRDAELSGSVAMARDMWMLSWYMGGMNYADMVQVDWSGSSVTFVRSKTRGRTKGRVITKLPVCEEARMIVNKYLRDGRLSTGLHFSSDKGDIGYIGKLVRRMGAMLHIESDLCFYSARHSFSQMALECGINDVVVDYILGHSSSRRGVISYYSAVTPRMAAMAMERVRRYAEHPDEFEDGMLAAIMR